MGRAASPPRPSIFDVLSEKHPELAGATAGARRPSGSPTWKASGLSSLILLFLGIGLAGLLWVLNMSSSGPDSSPLRKPWLATETKPAEPTESSSSRSSSKTPDKLPPAAGAAAVTVDPEKRASLFDVSEEPPPVRRWKPPEDVSTFARNEPGTARVTPPAPARVTPPAPARVTPPAPAPGGAVAEEIAVPAREWRPAVRVAASAPTYPEAARIAGLTGTVIVEAKVDPEGAVSSARVLHGVAPELDRAALDAVWQWRFEPATHGGTPASDTYRGAVRFALEPPAKPPPTKASAKPEERGGFKPPVKLYGPRPRYPQEAWLQALEGDVVLRAAIDAQGKVTGVEVVQGLSEALDAAAALALEKWRFRPANKDGRPVAASHLVRFRFAR